MIKFIGIVLLLGGIFWAGYYIGQQPPEDVKRTIRTLSENVVDQTVGLEEGRLDLKQEFLEAKSRLLDGKAEILDGEYGEAAKALGKALAHVKNAVEKQGKETSRVVIDGLVTKLNDIKQSLASGQNVSQEKIDEAQKDLDSLISRE
jgi:predicted enzyme involved in methoxymalonyl-ACP biosynthesis